MNEGIIGITNMKVDRSAGMPLRIQLDMAAGEEYDTRELAHVHWRELFPGNAIVKCRYCSQYAARKTACVHCGAPVD